MKWNKIRPRADDEIESWTSRNFLKARERKRTRTLLM